MERVQMSMAQVFALCLTLASILQTGIAYNGIPGDLLIPEQHLEAREDRRSAGIWKLLANISALEIQCAKKSVTATFMLKGDWEIANVVFAGTSGRSGGLPYFYGPMNVAEVILDELGNNEEPSEECGGSFNETLALMVHCPGCSSVTSVVRFFSGRALKSIPRQRLMVMGPEKKPIGGTSTWRLATMVHEDLLGRGGGTKFTGIFRFPLIKHGPVTTLAARPRNLLTNDLAWYTTINPDGSWAVIVAFQLPQKWNSSRFLPRVEIDIECEACDISRADVGYEHPPPEWISVKRRLIYENYWVRSGRHGKMPYLEKDPVCKDQHGCWKLKATVGDICKGIYNGMIHLVAQPASSRLEFYWMLGPSDKAMRYEAEVGVNEVYYVVQWSPKHETELCSKAATTDVSLHLTCEKCTVSFPGLRLPEEPPIPNGASLQLVAHLYGSWDALDASCELDVAVKRNPVVGDIPLLWLDPHAQCQPLKDGGEYSTTHQIAPIRWLEMRNVLRDWEKTITHNLTGNLRRTLYGGSECLCRNLRGRVYRLINWASIELQSDNKDGKVQGNKGASDVFVKQQRNPLYKTNVSRQSVAEDLPVSTKKKTVLVKFGQQRIEGRQLPSSPTLWSFSADISAPDIQCATASVTARIGLKSDGRVSEVVSATAGREVVSHFYPLQQLIEIVLKPLTTSEDEEELDAEEGTFCAVQRKATLSFLLWCGNCTQITSFIKYTLGMPFPIIGLEPMEPIGPAKLVEGRPTTWRLCAVVHKSVLERGKGANFTAVISFPPVHDTEIGSFAVRLRTLVTKENAWYIDKSSGGGREVVAALQLPPDWKIDNPPVIVLDVECENCEKENVMVMYTVDRPEWRSVQKRQLYDSFWMRTGQFGDTPQLEEKPLLCDSHLRCWEIKVSLGAMCDGIFQGVISFVIEPYTSVAEYRWRSGFDDRWHEAEVGANLGQRVVRWSLRNTVDLCRQDADSYIALRIDCDKCRVTSPKMYLPWDPEVPLGASSEVVARLYGSWDKSESICRIDLAAKVATLVGDIPRLWVDRHTDCDNAGIGDDISSLSAFFSSSDSSSPNRTAAPDWRAIRRLLRHWETGIAQKSNRLHWSFSGASECLCEKLRGRMYRLVDWDEEPVFGDEDKTNLDDRIDDMDGSVVPFDEEGQAGSGEVSVTPGPKYMAPLQRVTGHQKHNEPAVWELTANITAPGIQCSKKSVVVIFKLESGSDDGRVRVGWSSLKRLPFKAFHRTREVAEFTLPPYDSKIDKWCVPQPNATITLEVYCPWCKKIKGTVRFVPGVAFDDIKPHFFSSCGPRDMNSSAPFSYRLTAKVHHNVLDRGPGTRFTAVLEFPPIRATRIKRFSVRFRTLFDKEESWYTEEWGEGTRWVYAALRLPEHWEAKRPPAVIVDVECDDCDISRVALSYKSTRSEWLGVKPREIYESFFSREGRYGVEPTVKEMLSGCEEGFSCWEIETGTGVFCNRGGFTAGFEFFIQPYNTKGNFHWISSTDGKQYEAQVGANEWRRLVQMTPDTEWSLCSKSPTSNVKLRVTCRWCTVDYPAIFIPWVPDVPLGASREVVTRIFGSWEENEVCQTKIEGDETPTTVRENGILRLWIDPLLDCPEVLKRSHTMSSEYPKYDTWTEKRTILGKWEEQLRANLSNVTQTVAGGSKCLCNQLKGVVYRLVDWEDGGDQDLQTETVTEGPKKSGFKIRMKKRSR